MRTQSARASRHLLVFGLATAGLVAAIIAAYAAVHAQMHWFSASVPPDLPPKWVVVSLIIFLAAIVSSIVGFAFSAIAGALIVHYIANGVEAVQIMMIAS